MRPRRRRTASTSSGSGSEAVAGDEAGRPQHAEGIVGERLVGRQGGAQAMAGQVGESAEGVDELGRAARAQLEGHGVDGEVAAGEVGLDRVGEGHLRLAGVGGVGLGPVGGDLVDDAVLLGADGAEAAGPGPRRRRPSPGGSASVASGRASVVKSRSLGERAAEDGVADAAAHQVQAVAGGREALGEGGGGVEKRLQPLGDHGDNDGTGRCGLSVDSGAADAVERRRAPTGGRSRRGRVCRKQLEAPAAPGRAVEPPTDTQFRDRGRGGRSPPSAASPGGPGEPTPVTDEPGTAPLHPRADGAGWARRPAVRLAAAGGGGRTQPVIGPHRAVGPPVSSRAPMTVTTEVLEWGRERARAGPWRGDGHVAYLAPLPYDPPPSADFLLRCLDQLARSGLRRGHHVGPGRGRAAAVPGRRASSPTSTSASWATTWSAYPSGPRPAPTTCARRSPADYPWCSTSTPDPSAPSGASTEAGLEEALTATPSTRFRVALAPHAGGRRRVMGYAITGRAGDQGYLQRLAVATGARRAGVGRALADRRPALAAATGRGPGRGQHPVRATTPPSPSTCASASGRSPPTWPSCTEAWRRDPAPRRRRPIVRAGAP